MIGQNESGFIVGRCEQYLATAGDQCKHFWPPYRAMLLRVHTLTVSSLTFDCSLWEDEAEDNAEIFCWGNATKASGVNR